MESLHARIASRAVSAVQPLSSLRKGKGIVKMNKEVENYIEKQKSPLREICQKLRKIILKTFPDMKEEMKMGVPWYEGKYYIVAIKTYVNLGFSINGLSNVV